MRSRYMETPAPQRKLLQRKELARRSQDMRAEHLNLVLTNGCFDILHVGHVRYLFAARALGDALAVGVNGNASARKLKGPGRPVVPAEERAEIIAALECVDFVTIFDEETASELVGDVKPHFYVKGGDYASDARADTFPVEGHIVLSYGGVVKTIEYVPEHSTTELVARMRQLAEQESP